MCSLGSDIIVYTKHRRTLEEVEVLVRLGDVKAFYQTPEWKAKRLEVLQRDNNNCQRCLGKYINKDRVKHIKITEAKYVHHIVPLKQRFDLALESDNLVSLCFNCHEIVEGRQNRIIKEKKKRLNEERW